MPTLSADYYGNGYSLYLGALFIPLGATVIIRTVTDDVRLLSSWI